jgi:hypothetical protein
MTIYAAGFQIGGLLSVALLIYGAYLAFVYLFNATDMRHAPFQSRQSRFRGDSGAVSRNERDERPQVLIADASMTL